MQNGDEASPSTIFAGRALFMKMLITLQPRGAFGILHTEHHFRGSTSFSENAHNSLTALYILINFAHFYFHTVSRQWYAKRSLGFTKH